MPCFAAGKVKSLYKGQDFNDWNHVNFFRNHVTFFFGNTAYFAFESFLRRITLLPCGPVKKTLLILLATCYLMGSSGLVVCLGKCREFFQSLAADGATAPQGCCGHKDSSQTSAGGCRKGCCKDTKCMLKLQTSQQLSAKHEWAAKLLPTAVIINDEPFVYQARVPSYRVPVLPDYHAPPSRYKNPLYLHYRVLLI